MSTLMQQQDLAAMQESTYPWWRILLEGVVAILIGLMLMFSPKEGAAIAFKLIGLYWLISGLLTLIHIFKDDAEGERLWLLVQGVVTIIAALLVFNLDASDGELWSLTLTWIVAGSAILIGVVGLLQAFRGGGLAAAVLGLLSLGFGVYILGDVLLPVGLIAWFVGLLAIVGGALSIYFSLTLKPEDEGDENVTESSGNPLLGVFRIAILLVVMLAGIAVVFVAWLLPIERRGIRLHSWVITWLCRIVNRILRIEVVCTDEEKLIDLHGILFVNHVSFLDIPVVIAILPMRFLSTADVFQVPFVGWVADSIATVFVDRSDKSSRRDVRDAIAKNVTEQSYPPFVIFPEGRFGTATSLRPFHYGSFDIAAQNSIPYLSCALRYSRPDVAIWRGIKEESFFQAAVRVLSFRGWMRAELYPLELVQPDPNEDAETLAHQSQRAIEEALGFAHAPTDLESASSAAEH